MIKEKSKFLTKSIADIIDEFFVPFTFKNTYEANLLNNYIDNNKEKIRKRIINKEKENNEISNEMGRSLKNIDARKINPTLKKSSNETNTNLCSNKDSNFGFSYKTTNYKYAANYPDSKDSINFRNTNNKKNFNNFQYKVKIDFVNNSEEANSEVISVMDIHGLNNFFSVK